MLLVAVAHPRSPITSPIPGVATDDAWAAWLAGMTVQGVTATSESGGIGMFALRPSRLAEIGIMDPATLRREKLPSGRWRESGEFVAPWSRATFFLDEQHEAISISVRVYLAEIAARKIVVPDGVSTAGALAVLQRGKRAALGAYPNLLSDTLALYERVKGCFA